MIRPDPLESHTARLVEARRHGRVFLIEHYGAAVSETDVAALARTLARAARNHRPGVRLVGSVCVPGDESFLSLFTASCAEAVALAVAEANITADRIVPAFWRDASGR